MVQGGPYFLGFRSGCPGSQRLTIEVSNTAKGFLMCVFKQRGLDRSSGGSCGSDGTDLPSGEARQWACHQLPASSCCAFRDHHSVQEQTTLSPESYQSVTQHVEGTKPGHFCTLGLFSGHPLHTGGPAETFSGLHLIWKLLLPNLPLTFSQVSDLHSGLKASPAYLPHPLSFPSVPSINLLHF